MANRWTLNEEHLNVDKYLKACANLYGYVTPRQFLKLYNRYNEKKINKEKYLLWLERLHNHSYLHYTLYSNAIVCSRVSHEKIDEILYYQQGKKYYDPPKDELLKYADPNYYEQSIYTKEMLNFLIKDLKINRLTAESFLAKLVWYMRIEESVQAENDLLESFGIKFNDLTQANNYFLRAQFLNNNTRKWANCGYTPKELSDIYSKNKG